MSYRYKEYRVKIKGREVGNIIEGKNFVKSYILLPNSFYKLILIN